MLVVAVGIGELPAVEIISTIAGSGSKGDGGPAIDGILDNPLRVACDAAGNIYVSTTGRIRRIDVATGIITTVVGTGVQGFAGDGGQAVAAQISVPSGLAFDAAGNLYFCDKGGPGLEYGDNRVRRLAAATGIITTIAGNGVYASSADGGLAVDAELRCPDGIAVDAAGDVYFTERNGNRVRKVTMATGIISTVAGTGVAGFSGDGGLAIAAQLNIPTGVSFDAVGDMYITDESNQRVRKVVMATGVISTVVGNGATSVGPWTGNIAGVGDGGAATVASLYDPDDVKFDAAGNMYIADPGHYRIRRVDHATGNISTVMGTGASGFSGDGGAATGAASGQVYGIALDPAGNLWFADLVNHRVREIAAGTGIVTTVSGGIYLTTDGIQATAAEVPYPTDVAIEASGDFLVVDRANLRVRRIAAATGLVTTVAGSDNTALGDGGPAISASFRDLRGVAVAGNGDIFIADAGRVRRIEAATGDISTVAGKGQLSGWDPTNIGDGGLATNAVLMEPSQLVLDGHGLLYIAETDNGRIRVVNLSTGLISSIVGSFSAGGPSFSGDGGPATACTLSQPAGIAFDAAGDLIIADSYNGRLRRVDAGTGIISTIAGDGTLASSGDGGLASAASLYYPYHVAVAPSGDIYVSEYIGNRIRKIEASTGIITTVAGTGTAGFSGDGGPAATAMISNPQGLCLTGSGSLIFADAGNSRIRMLSSQPGELLAITAVDGGATPTAGSPFPVSIEIHDAGGAVEPALHDTVVRLTLYSGSGALAGTVQGTIAAGVHSVDISGLTYDRADTGVVLTATASGGDALTAGDSAPFDVTGSGGASPPADSASGHHRCGHGLGIAFFFIALLAWSRLRSRVSSG